jgi:hypothetical protein
MCAYLAINSKKRVKSNPVVIAAVKRKYGGKKI